MPDLASFRRDLAVLVAGFAADLVVGDGRASPAGARDLVIAIQYAFDMLVLGSQWPDDAPTGSRSRPLTNALAEMIMSRAFAETERAIAAATHILVARPIATKGSDHGA